MLTFINFYQCTRLIYIFEIIYCKRCSGRSTLNGLFDWVAEQANRPVAFTGACCSLDSKPGRWNWKAAEKQPSHRLLTGRLGDIVYIWCPESRLHVLALSNQKHSYNQALGKGPVGSVPWSRDGCGTAAVASFIFPTLEVRTCHRVAHTSLSWAFIFSASSSVCVFF